MPTNVTATYRKAEQDYRQARSAAERLACLKEMLRTIPKHKGTEHLQADIKTRIRQLTDELSGPRKGGARSAPVHSVRPEGAAQICLVGPPNVGKSALHRRLTGSHTDVGPYPFTTKLPVPGMLPHEDIHIQLVDLPPISAEFMEPWYANALQHADAALLVVDLTDPACVDDVPAIRHRLAERKVTLTEDWPAEADQSTGAGIDDDPERLQDPFAIRLPTLLVANKFDLAPRREEITVFEELLGLRYPYLATSAQTGYGLDALGPRLFRDLGIVRVYTKVPGKPPDKDRPFTVRRGHTIADVARLVHRDVAQTLRFARVWGSGQFDGQQVGPDHRVDDGDIVELHTG